MAVKFFVAVTGCAAGIAHTYMAQGALEKAAEELGITAKVETQGTIGTENELTEREIEQADVVIIAADIHVDKSRFVGKKILEVDTNQVLKDAKSLIETASEKAVLFSGKGMKVGKNMEVGSSSNKVVKFLMSGLTDMIPIAIAAGLLLAFANTFAFQPDPNNADLVVWGFSDDAKGMFFSKLFDLGKIGFTLMIPIFAAGVARAIGDKPAVAPAFIAGYMINDAGFLGTETGAGFLGAIIVGFGVGYLVRLLKSIPWPNMLKPVVPILIIPLISAFISFIVIYYLIGQPVALGMNSLYTFINDITKNYAAAPIIYGAILGGMMGVDLGGPINKTAILVSQAIFVDTMAQFGPDGVNAIPQAAACSAIAVAPLGAAFATWLFKKYFTTDERALGSSAFVMGIVGITEGAIPFAAAHPSLIIANTISSAISGAFIAAVGIQFYGGIGSPLGAFIGYTTGPTLAWLWWILIILFSALINAVLYRMTLRKRVIVNG
ncbi:fructose-specific PTS transporter subunit EIIC [Niallia sp. Man26]|uniref:PTS fructose transporter subunit IIC n=1 Tax=Niallia sp. Man26 TaxID=2912824 RepID=UPI001EDB0144|nr:fructose-specific PTS transporter subunit EIIC [Niallia sp. Man26]UPO88033.1 fructose-specific PTS transporter subunit EIIC [Niallia sp. Man26]